MTYEITRLQSRPARTSGFAAKAEVGIRRVGKRRDDVEEYEREGLAGFLKVARPSLVRAWQSRGVPRSVGRRTETFPRRPDRGAAKCVRAV